MKNLGERVKKLLSFFYGVVIAALSFLGGAKAVSYFLKKHHERQLRQTKAHHEYLSIRPLIDESFVEQWDRIQVYAQWLRDRMVKTAGGSGRRARDVSDEEIKQLIKSCTEFEETINKAICKEHKVIKKLPSGDGITISTNMHNEWHWMFHGARRIRNEFKTLLLNQYRRTIH